MPKKATPRPRAPKTKSALTAAEKRFVTGFGAELAVFIRRETGGGRSMQEVVDSLRRTAPAALLLGSLVQVTALVEASLATAEFMIIDETDPPPARPSRRKRSGPA